MTDKKKIQIDKEFLDLILKQQENLKTRVGKIEGVMKDVVIRKGEAIPHIDNGDLILNGVINHFQLPKEKQDEFFNKLRALMREYGIYSVKADLIKKF